MSHSEIETEIEELEIEAFAQTGSTERAPKAKRYVIRIDKQKYPVTVSTMTGRQILELAGKVPPGSYKLTQKVRGGGASSIGLDQEVDFRAPGVERFMTLKRDQTEGELRKQFALPSSDSEHLCTTGLTWETVLDNGSRWLLIHNHPVPSGYNVERVTVALQVPPGYPDSEIDMAYFHPPLSRTDGKPIGALAPQDLDGKAFQRWSRHRTAESGWRSGEDDVSSHLVLVDDWLVREFEKQ